MPGVLDTCCVLRVCAPANFAPSFEPSMASSAFEGIR